MSTRTLGKTGYTVSEIGLGCWQLGESFGPVNDETAAEILRTARSLDVNFWDTADVYGGGQSESRIGGFRDKKGVLVATKLGRGPQFEGMTRYTRERVNESLAGSIKRLGVETLDLATELRHAQCGFHGQHCRSAARYPHAPRPVVPRSILRDRDGVGLARAFDRPGAT